MRKFYTIILTMTVKTATGEHFHQLPESCQGYLHQKLLSNPVRNLPVLLTERIIYAKQPGYCPVVCEALCGRGSIVT